MSTIAKHKYPKLHNAMWPGLVGKGGPGSEPPIDLDTMLNLTAAAEVDGVRFDGVDLFLFDCDFAVSLAGDLIGREGRRDGIDDRNLRRCGGGINSREIGGLPLRLFFR